MSPLPRSIRLAVSSAVVCVALVGTAPVAHSQTWVEQSDAGDLPGIAQTTLGNGPLTTISGTLPVDSDVDMYCIRITDPVTFVTAYLSCLAINENDIWLFDAAGLGVARDRGCQGGQTRVGTPIVTAGGLYYIAVSGNDGSAQNAGSDLWLVGTPVTGQVAPNGPAAGFPVTGWNGGAVNPTSYTINLAGATYCDGVVPALPRSWGATKLIYR